VIGSFYCAEWGRNFTCDSRAQGRMQTFLLGFLRKNHANPGDSAVHSRVGPRYVSVLSGSFLEGIWFFPALSCDFR